MEKVFKDLIILGKGKFGFISRLVRSIINYAKENMFLGENIKKVKEYVEIVKKKEFKK